MGKRYPAKLLSVVLIIVILSSVIISSTAFAAPLDDDLVKRVVEEGYLVKSICNLTKAYEDPAKVRALFEYYMYVFSPQFNDYKNGKLDGAKLEESLKMLQNLRKAVKSMVDPESQKIYIWPEGKMPGNTTYTENPEGQYWDKPGFRPYIVPYLLDKSVKAKGAVIISPGGGYTSRSEPGEGDPYAKYFNSIGYHAFVLNYRVAPYTQMESALDLQRAVRYVRYNAGQYGFDPDNIVIIGSSAGGSVTLDVANEFYGDIQPNKVVKNYVPDNIDKMSSDVKAVIAMYTGLAVLRPYRKIINPAFPATFMAIGNLDRLKTNTMETARLLKEQNVPVELHIFEGAGHGFGLGFDFMKGGIPILGADKWPELAGIWLDKVLAAEKRVAFTDIEDSPAKDTINKLVSSGVIYGEKNKFHPSREITVAEFAAMIERSLYTEINYTNEGAWYMPYMDAGTAIGLFNDVSGAVNPTGILTLDQSKIIIANAVKYAEKDAAFVDKIFKGKASGKLTRENAAIIVDRFISDIMIR